MAALLQADDLDAINRYITTEKIRTPEAQALRDEWIRWHDGLSWGDRAFDRPTLDRARNARLQFQLSNATTDAERAEIWRVATTGMSLEQMQGEADRRDSSGHYSERAASWLGSSFSHVALGAGLALGGLYLLKRAL